MITVVRSVGINTGDQDRAKRFWTETMGFELVQDTPLGEAEGSPRWIAVTPPDRNVILVLFTPEEHRHLIGTFSNIVWECPDIHDTYEELVTKGVEFTESPRQEFWGWWAVFKDPDGNTYGLGQSRVT